MVFSHRSFRTENPLLGRSRSGVGVGVGVDIFRPESELESESLKIRRLRSNDGKYYRVIALETGKAMPQRFVRM